MILSTRSAGRAGYQQLGGDSPVAHDPELLTSIDDLYSLADVVAVAVAVVVAVAVAVAVAVVAAAAVAVAVVAVAGQRETAYRDQCSDEVATHVWPLHRYPVDHRTVCASTLVSAVLACLLRSAARANRSGEVGLEPYVEHEVTSRTDCSAWADSASMVSLWMKVLEEVVDTC